jgi:hypothetical protein
VERMRAAFAPESIALVTSGPLMNQQRLWHAGIYQVHHACTEHARLDAMQEKANRAAKPASNASALKMTL